MPTGRTPEIRSSTSAARKSKIPFGRLVQARIELMNPAMHAKFVTRGHAAPATSSAIDHRRYRRHEDRGRNCTAHREV